MCVKNLLIISLSLVSAMSSMSTVVLADGSFPSENSVSGYARLEREIEQDQEKSINAQHHNSRYYSTSQQQYEADAVLLYRQNSELQALAQEFQELEKASFRIEQLLHELEESKLRVARAENRHASTDALPIDNEQVDSAGIIEQKAFDIPLTQIEEDHRADRVRQEELLFVDKRIGVEMPIAIVRVPAAPLLAGPTPEREALYRAKEGEIVAIEKRFEEWYRVIHESGIRGWISADELLFGPDSRSLPGKIVRIHGYDISSDRNDWEPAS